MSTDERGLSSVQDQRDDAGEAGSGEDFVQLRSDAERVASGLRLLRWALIVWFASQLLSYFSWPLIDLILSPSWEGLVWSEFTVEMPGWAVAPLALVGVVRLLRVKTARVPRWVGISLIAYFAAQCVLKPLWSVLALGANLDFLGGETVWFGPTFNGVALAVMLFYFAVLFAGNRLAEAVDDRFDRSLISRQHRLWLLWIMVVLHGMTVVWWILVRIWTAREGASDGFGDPSDLTGMLVAAAWLTIGIPFFAWYVWLLVVAFRIGRKLKRFVNLNCCLRCGYDLRERVEDGCPECGWMRTGQPVVGCS